MNKYLLLIGKLLVLKIVISFLVLFGYQYGKYVGYTLAADTIAPPLLECVKLLGGEIKKQ